MKRRIPIFLILTGVLGSVAAIAADGASTQLPEAWKPYLWVAWPVFIACTLAGIGLVVWHWGL
ncbi:MAG: hypothetical protein RMK79_07520 [Anaerolineae bacterium]|nr:hypothetical protein [Anaerolineae bacterium]